MDSVVEAATSLEVGVFLDGIWCFLEEASFLAQPDLQQRSLMLSFASFWEQFLNDSKQKREQIWK